MDTRQPTWGDHRLGALASGYLRMIHALPTGSFMRRIALWLRKPLKASLPAQVDLRVWGLELRLQSSGNLSEQRLILMPQFLDALERTELRSMLQDGGTFLDIGANAGIYSLWVAATCRSARVESFEPDPTLCARLQWNLDHNQLSNIYLNRIALGRSEGEVRLQSGHGNQGENRIVASSEEGRAVAMKPLASVLLERGVKKIRAMKIDIEGMEVDVLEPYFTTVPKENWPDLIVCEVLKDGETTDLLKLLKNHGYHMKQRGRMNGLFYQS